MGWGTHGLTDESGEPLLPEDTDEAAFDGLPTRNAFLASHALLEEGWRRNVLIRFNDDGIITTCLPDSPPVPGVWNLTGAVIPGLCSAHSHAFQRAMAGQGEAGAGDFWTWREAMYRLAGRLDPDDMRSIAAWVQLEMLLTGYTSVIEFHYLHNQPDGRPYDDPDIMCRALLQAADDTGINLALCPSLYMTGGFDARALEGGQRRFAGTPEAMLDRIGRLHADDHNTLLGLHSLRAVPPEALRDVLNGYRKMAPDGPVHIHIAEQQREVTDCLAARGARPVDWLLDHAPVDALWCLVHATHMTEAETLRMAASGCIAGLCPTTEANLADGLFPLGRYLGAGGRIAIGSDSNVRIDAFEELRLLDYGQRLLTGRRGLAADGHDRGLGVGTRLWRAAHAGGKAALGYASRGLGVGEYCDVLLINTDHPSLYGRTEDDMLNSLIYAVGPETIDAVFVAGQLVIERSFHPNGAMIDLRYQATMRKLLDL